MLELTRGFGTLVSEKKRNEVERFAVPKSDFDRSQRTRMGIPIRTE